MQKIFLAIAAAAFSIALTAGAALAGEPVAAAATPRVVDITVRGMTFRAPAEVPAGWTTFRLRNESGMTHFAAIERMPAGIGIAEQQAQVAPVFQQGMDLLNAGENDAAMAKFGELPEWFGKVEFIGGPGMTGPGQVAETTVFLEPGIYLLECYVKTAGVFHSYNPAPDIYGMVAEFAVTGEADSTQAPQSSLGVSISSAAGIEMTGEPTPGQHTVAVHFVDQKVHENFVEHDVHLVKLDDAIDLEVLEAWMDWRLPGGLQTPAPAVFLGGVNEMPAGQTGYMNVRLEPGRYAWIAEVPGSMDKGMLKTFTVEPVDRPARP